MLYQHEICVRGLPLGNAVQRFCCKFLAKMAQNADTNLSFSACKKINLYFTFKFSHV